MQRSFAGWVEEVASVLAADAAEVLVFAREAPAEFWESASVVEGWMNRDILAHLAGGNDQMVQIVLRAVVAGASIEAAALEPDTDAENERRIVERRSWSIDELVAEFKRDGDEVLELLSALRDEDEGVRLGGTALTVRKLLHIVQHERHDHLHLEQLRAGRAGFRDERMG